MRSASFNVRFSRWIFAAGLFCATVAYSTPCRADCDWPEWQPEERRESYPVRVDDYIFTTGYYSYWVAAYRINSLRCSDSIDTGPRDWSVIIGLGGDETIGPRTSSSEQSTENQPAERREYSGDRDNTSVRAQTPLPSLQVLPSAPALPPLPALAPVQPLPPIPALSPLPALPPVSALPPLQELPPLPPIPPQ